MKETLYHASYALVCINRYIVVVLYKLDADMSSCVLNKLKVMMMMMMLYDDGMVGYFCNFCSSTDGAA